MFDPDIHDVLVRYAESLIGKDAAEDVVQNFYVRVLRGQVPPFNGRSAHRTWMLAILKRTAYRWRRNEKKHPVPTEINGDAAGRVVPQYELRLDVQAQVRRVEQALAALPLADQRLLRIIAHTRARFNLRVRRRLAAALGISTRNLDTRLYRARQKLKALL